MRSACMYAVFSIAGPWLFCDCSGGQRKKLFVWQMRVLITFTTVDCLCYQLASSLFTFRMSALI